MRRLPSLQQRRAVWLSLCLHGALIALATFARLGEPPVEAGAPIIEAELVALLPPRAPRQPDTPALPEVLTTTPLPSPDSASAEAAPAPSEPPSPAPTPLQQAQVAPPEPSSVAEPNAPALQAASADSEPQPTATEASAASGDPEDDEAASHLALESEVDDSVRRRLASWTGRIAAGEPAPIVEWRDRGQRYTAVLTKLPATGAMNMEQVRVEVSTERDGERLTTELRMTRIAFSNFAQFIDRWDPDVRLHDDVIDGRFHANTAIGVSRDGTAQPVFNGKVTLAARDITTEGAGFLNRRKTFPAGLETNVRRIVLPPRSAGVDTAAVPSERAHRIARDASLVFQADGSYEWRHDDDGDGGRRMLDDEPFYVIAAEDASLSVRGIVNGQVLVYSPQRIVIVGDLRYAQDPRDPGAGDYLGLVAERTVEVDEPDVIGDGDLTIHASIYARQRFQVRSYRSRRSGTLSIYGSLAAGSVSATEPRYATKIEFDERLTTMRAPGFPLSDRYELDSWNGEWRVVDSD